METYRLSSKLNENDREYLIQTSNEPSQGAIATTVFVDGVRTDTYCCPYPDGLTEADLLVLVKQTHGDRKAEMEDLLKACRSLGDQGDSGAMFRLATSLHYRRLYREAGDLLNVITRINAENHEAHHLQAKNFLALKQATDAVQSATEAVRLRPGYADYRNCLAEALLMAGTVADAIAELEAAISINLYYGEAYFNLGLARTLEVARSGEPQLREKGPRSLADCFRKAQLIHPELGDQEDFQNGLKALDAQDYIGALHLLRRVRESYREYRRREFVAANRRILTPDESLSSDALNEQIRSLRSQLEAHPNYLDWQTELARCYFELAGKMWDQGIDECRRILEAHAGMTQVADAMEQARNIRQSFANTVASITGKG